MPQIVQFPSPRDVVLPEPSIRGSSDQLSQFDEHGRQFVRQLRGRAR
ncbi:hypothetical protein [Microbacterium suaedae]|nr:hypothetical protein [Microbacterium suaedae]